VNVEVPVLTDGEVTLRRHELSDVDDIVTQCVDPDSVRWTTVPVPYTRDDALGWVGAVVPEGWRTEKELLFAIESTHPDGQRRFSGSISLRPMDKDAAEIAYGLHPAARGKGVCGRAVKLILDWGFQQPGIDLVVWYAHVGNWASWRVAWANGFSFDGKVKSFLSQRGERHDAWCGSLRADDDREPKHPWHVSPVLESSRLRLRPHRADDAPRYAEILADERGRHFISWAAPVLQRPLEAAVLRALEANARGERYDWTIADRDSDEFIGQIQLFGLGGMDPTSAEVGYSVHPSSRGKGVVTEALRMVVAWAFRAKEHGGLGLRRLELDTAATNKASRHAAEQAGFVHMATHSEAFPRGDRVFDDAVIYHQLNPSWAMS